MQVELATTLALGNCMYMCCWYPQLCADCIVSSLPLLAADRAAGILESQTGTSAAVAEPALYARAASWVDKVTLAARHIDSRQQMMASCQSGAFNLVAGCTDALKDFSGTAQAG